MATGGIRLWSIAAAANHPQRLRPQLSWRFGPMPKNPSVRTPYVVLPAHGLGANQGVSTETAQFLSLLDDRLRQPQQKTAALALRKVAGPIDIHVLDSIHENGVKLIEIRDSEVADLRAQAPGLRIIPVVHYH